MQDKDKNKDKQNATFLGSFIPSRNVKINPTGKVEPAYFIGTENGIEDIDCPPDEGELPDQEWADQPKEYDP